MRVQLIEETELEMVRRTLGYLAACGEHGTTRSDLMQRYRLSATGLDNLVEHLRQREGFHETTVETKGRPSQRYTFQPVFTVRDVNGRRRCIWCSTVVAEDRDSTYCSDGCRRLGVEERVTMKVIMGTPKLDGALGRAGRFVVAAYLAARGYFPLLADNPATLEVRTVYDYRFSLHIIIADETGEVGATLLAQFRGAAVAVVLRTGRVLCYGLPTAEAPTPTFENAAQKEGGPV